MNFLKLGVILLIAFIFHNEAFTMVGSNEKIPNNYELSINPTSTGKILISWLVPSSNKVDFVYVQKSVNRNSYVNIAKVNYTGLKAYSIEDEKPQNEFVFYRLIIVDKQGNFRISSTVKYQID